MINNNTAKDLKVTCYYEKIEDKNIYLYYSEESK